MPRLKDERAVEHRWILAVVATVGVNYASAGCHSV
jgi:hypothetical protein